MRLSKNYNPKNVIDWTAKCPKELEQDIYWSGWGVGFAVGVTCSVVVGVLLTILVVGG